MLTAHNYDPVAEAERALHIPRHRAPYDAHARMNDKIGRHATPYAGRHRTEVHA